MKLNTGIVAHSLPTAPQFICGTLNHILTLADIRILIPEHNLFTNDILYFAVWDELTALDGGTTPDYLCCVGGGEDARAFFEHNGVTGFIMEEQNPFIVFGIIQSIFRHYNELERNLMEAVMLRSPTKILLNCCAEFFHNHAILFDSELNLIDYSSNYLPDEDDPVWKETLETKKRSEIIFQETKKNIFQIEPAANPHSEIVDLGPGFQRNMINAFYDSNRRIAMLIIAENNKPMSACQAKLLDYISEIISPSLFFRYSALYGSLEILRSVFVTILNKVNVDPLVISRSMAVTGWKMKDDYRLILIHVPDISKKPEVMTQYLYLYENIFPDCVAFKFIESLVLIVHNDTTDVMNACMPKLEKQLELHDAVCGVSLPFNSILQVNSQYKNADTAIQHGDTNKKIRYVRDILTYHLIDTISADTPLIPLCSREALRVFDYDLENDTKLLLTLEVYLKHNKSLKLAATELFIHRSTLTYRLDSIKKLVNMNLDDADERLHILLSCIVLRNLNTGTPRVQYT